MISVDISKKLHSANGQMWLQLAAEIEEGSLVALYGASGAGKTSILKILAGLMAPDKGLINVGGQVWFSKPGGIDLRPQQRGIGMVFQDYSLFPNMTVRGNLEYALEKGQPKEIVEELLQLTGLEQLQGKKPKLLSGGQQQRVALARALVRRPKLLLLDEPLSALDAEMRAKLQDYILDIQQKFKPTTVLVSHDLMEVMKMAERVLVIEEGKVVKDGLPEKVLPIHLLDAFTKKKP